MAEDGAQIIRGCRRVLITLLLSAIAPLLAACYDDGMEELMELENTYVQTLPLLIPDGYPVPGNGGIITTMDITLSSVRLSWQRATDDVTPQGDLRYRVYYANEPIPTAAAAMAVGTPFNGWTADLTGMDVTGLLGSTVYYFNVLVRDGDLHVSSYIMVSATTSDPAATIYLFSAGSPRRGNLSTMYTASLRNDLDDICRDSATYKALGKGNVRAFISAPDGDSIRMMPVNHGVPVTWPIKSVWGDTIAANWYALFYGIGDTLQDLGVIDGFWWSGSLADGSYDAAGNCNGWANGTGGFDGAVGAHHRTTMQWLHWGR
ncbi:MAG: fibronectin type III domain-containing protein, partial [Spirochaetes bacterium]|nr:fibronectin type III domain-containing protein [Spirochaetota bacterium]